MPILTRLSPLSILSLNLSCVWRPFFRFRALFPNKMKREKNDISWIPQTPQSIHFHVHNQEQNPVQTHVVLLLYIRWVLGSCWIRPKNSRGSWGPEDTPRRTHIIISCSMSNYRNKDTTRLLYIIYIFGTRTLMTMLAIGGGEVGGGRLWWQRWWWWLVCSALFRCDG